MYCADPLTDPLTDLAGHHVGTVSVIGQWSVMVVGHSGRSVFGQRGHERGPVRVVGRWSISWSVGGQCPVRVVGQWSVTPWPLRS